jgi:hypothetical protein
MICTDGKNRWKLLASKYLRAAVIITIGILNQAKN